MARTRRTRFSSTRLVVRSALVFGRTTSAGRRVMGHRRCRRSRGRAAQFCRSVRMAGRRGGRARDDGVAGAARNGVGRWGRNRADHGCECRHRSGVHEAICCAWRDRDRYASPQSDSRDARGARRGIPEYSSGAHGRVGACRDRRARGEAQRRADRHPDQQCGDLDDRRPQRSE